MNENQKLPSGLNWIRTILILGIIGGIISLVLKNTILPIVGIFQGIAGDILIVISIAIMIILVIQIKKRTEFTYKLALIWFGLEIIISVISFALYLNLADFLRIFLYLLFIWYILKRKDYFLHPEIPFNHEAPAIKRQEKILKFGVIIFIILLVATPRIVEVHRMLTVMPFGWAKLSVPEILDYCNGLDTNDKDYCIYNVVKEKNGDYDFGTGEVCQDITATDYRDGCYLLLKNCPKITDANMKQLCQTLWG